MVGKNKFITYFIAIAISILNLTGCGKPSPVEGEIYFMSNMFGGRTFKENRGTCVYEKGRVKKLFRYYWCPAVTRDGKKLVAFISGEKKTIAIVDLKKKQEERFDLQHHPQNFCWFNSDNGLLLYIGYDVLSKTEQVFNIYELDLKTKEEKQLTNYTEKDRGRPIYTLSLSPNNKELVYSITKTHKWGSGTYVKLLNLRTKAEENLPFSGGVTWSPTNNIIAIEGIYDYQGKKEIGPTIILYNTDTKEYTKLEKEEDYIMILGHTFSPDGKKLAYVRNEKNGRHTLWVMNIDGTNRKKLLDDGYRIENLSWTR